ncbi:MAG: hypothetical protein HY078_06715 [Elusimicrobia bacterium]|nr:hypothetical protein [Elusimicrobiota bacterium]
MRLLAAALFFAGAAGAQELRFEAREAGNFNAFYQAYETAYHVRVTPPPHARILFAFPAEDSGVFFAFDKARPENAGLRWSATESGPWEEKGIRGGWARVEADRAEIVLTSTILDSVRVIRDAVIHAKRVEMRRELDKALELKTSEWIEAKPEIIPSGILFTRSTLDGRNRYAAGLLFSEPVAVEAIPEGGWRIKSRSGKPLAARVQAGVDFTPLTPMPPEELLSPAALSAYKGKAAARVKDAIDRFRFLVYREKWLAGSHRFLTYFGRDTILSALLTWDAISPKARESALRSVLDRVSPEGRVAHEEDVAGQAEVRRMEEAFKLTATPAAAREALKNLDAPFFDYKMVDGEPLLAILARAWIASETAERREALLAAKSAQGATYRELLRRVLARVAADAAPYAKARRALLMRTQLVSPEERRALAKSLVSFRQPLYGDWRDSNEGNGFGPYSANVNAILFPRALALLAETAKAAKIGMKEITPEDPAMLAAEWSRAAEHFEVSLSSAEAARRLARFLEASGQDKKSLEARVGPLDKIGPVRFQAISLDTEGRPIEVMHSDGVLDLLLGAPTPERIDRILSVWERPYPLGLATEVGGVAANAAFSAREKDFELFGRAAYHGSVIWGWPQLAMIVGARAQAERFDGPIEARLQAAAGAAADAFGRAGPSASLELWAFALDAKGKAAASPFNLGSGDDAEANPAQLWSAAAFAAFLPAP